MVRFTAFLAYLSMAGPTASEGAFLMPSTSGEPLVVIEEETLTYIGGINAQGLESLREVLAAVPAGQVTHMVVNSGGGDTRAGMSIGEITADIQPHLTIEVGCFSSCANFIAPAAASITIRDGAFLGWHGNDRRFAIVAAQEGLCLREHLKHMQEEQLVDGADSGGNPADLDAILDEAMPVTEALIADEAAFYDRIGMANDGFAVCGVGARFDDRISGEQRGWGFSIADMAELGLSPVRFEGPGAYEESPVFRH